MKVIWHLDFVDTSYWYSKKQLMESLMQIELDLELECEFDIYFVRSITGF